MKTGFGIRWVAVVAVLLNLAGVAGAVDWANTGGGDFTNGANWVGGTAPSATGDARFKSNATYTVTFSANTNTANAYFEASTAGNVTLDLGAYAWTNTTAIYVGDSSSGNSLTLNNGGTLYGANMYLGSSGSSNTITVLNGTVSAGGNLNVANSSASATANRLVVSGSNSLLRTVSYDINIGTVGSGNSLTLTNGGQVRARQVIFGNGTGTGNWGLVTGAGSMLQALGDGEVQIGAGGSDWNWLTISAGGVVSNKNGYVGKSAGANSNSVVVSGGAWTNSTALYVGYNGAYGNSLTVSNGGNVYGGAFAVGQSATNNSLTVAGGTVAAGGHFKLGSAGGVNNTALVTGTSSVLQTVSYDIGIGNEAGGSVGYNNSLVVSNGGQAVSGRHLYVGGDGGTNNTVLVTGVNSLLQASAAGGGGANTYVGGSSGGGPGAYNALTVRDGARALTYHSYIGRGVGANSNSVLVSGGTWTNSGVLYVGSSGAYGNSLTVSNGGTVVSLSDAYVGDAATNNLLAVTGGTFVGAHLKVGTSGGANNRVLVTGPNSLLLAAPYDLHIGTDGGGSVGYNNSLVVSNGGQAATTRNLFVGGTGGTGNTLLVTDSGLLDLRQTTAPSITVGDYAGNSISNIGGIFQFAHATPTISPGSFGRIVVTNGTVSFKGITDADVQGSKIGTLANILFQGANTFRLNSASNTTANQTYTFGTGLGATNYSRLELINGATAYRGGDLTIGSGGSMLLSNTRATVTGLFTNNGVFTSLNSVGTFNSAVVNNGAWITDPTTNVFLSNYTVGNAGSISMTAGDVFIFKSNFVNQSVQSNTYNTLAGKFLFDGVSQTQWFYTAGKDLGPGWTYQSPLNITNVLGGHFGEGPSSSNFALGTLEVANFSTVRVSDVTLSLLGDDGQRAALYVDNLLLFPNSLLIVDTNVTVYFYQSNNWSFASNVLLLGDAELHQLIPEPSVLLLATGGALAVWSVRRRRAGQP